MLKRVLLSIVCLVSIFVGLLVAASPAFVSYASFTNYTTNSANSFQSGAYCSAYFPLGNAPAVRGNGSGVITLPTSSKSYVAIAAGWATGYAINLDGSVYAWGVGWNGRLGNGQTADSSVPVKVSLPSGVTATQVAAGDASGYVVGSDGAVYAWGAGSYGRLGNGQTADSSVPVKVSLPSGVTATQVAAADATGYAVGSDGAVYAWGDGSAGRLGNGQTADSSVPVKVSLPSGVTARNLAANTWVGYVVGSDGAVYAWGGGGNGQLGNGKGANSSIPVKVSLPSGVTATQVAAGTYAGYAVGSDGVTYAWGSGGSGQLGNGKAADSWTPVKVSLPSGVTATQVAAGYATAYAVGSDGAAYAWGGGGSGRLGNGQTANSSTPVKVSLPSGVTATQVAAGYAAGYVVGSDGAVYAWGAGSYGRLGSGQTADSWTPVKVSLPSGLAATQVAAGTYAAYAVGPDGAVYAWGDGSYGLLGNGQTASSSTPVKVSLPSGVTATQVAAGTYAAYAVGSDGAVYAWGGASDGQLGNGQSNDSSIPVKVSLPSGVTATQVAAGDASAYAVGSDGAVYAWGGGGLGQLGDGQKTEKSFTPVKVSLPTGVTAKQVAGGYRNGYAVGVDGTVYAWGWGSSGRLGNGQTADSWTPVKVSLPSGVTATQVAADTYAAFAVGSDGAVYAWGDGGYGLLGNGQTADSSTPVKVSLPSGVTVTQVAAGDASAYAVGSDGAVYAWGGGGLGQLGNGQKTAKSLTPVKVSLPTGVTAKQVAGGYRNGYAVGVDGTVYAWGWGSSGRLGNGQTADSSTPVKVGLMSWSLSSVANVTVAGVSVSYSRSGCSSSLTLLFAVPARDAGPTPVTVTFTYSAGSTYSYTKLLAVVPG